MSQNDRLLREKGLPVLTKAERDKLRAEWQANTWEDMILSLNSYNKYIMLRPTGFGKTYTCACACNIGKHAENGVLKLRNGAEITNPKILNIYKKKIIFVHVSDILKQTFDEYNNHKYKIDKKTGKYVYDKDGNKVIKQRSLIVHDENGDSRIIYETYSMVAGHWSDKNYLIDKMDINNVGLVIFDEVQRMGAEKTSKALDVALPILEELGIPFIGATATVERATGYDVCDKYFTYKHSDGNITYCWGESIYTLGEAFKKGLIIPPEYQYIEEDITRLGKARHTRAAILKELNAKLASDEATSADIKDMKELENAVIKNSSKLIHDTMLELYDCESSLITNTEKLEEVKTTQYKCPDKLPKYMRFLVFTPDRKSMTELRKDKDVSKVFGGMVKTTVTDFKEAFGRYGYKIRYTVISSYTKEEKENVKLIDNYELYKEEQEEREALSKISISHIKSDKDIESGKAIVPQDMVIDLIFSINMLNVGYHVNNITGLIFKRWTGSNSIFYQQLGRCLSSVSDIIPVVFDFVKSIDSRGITAPMFTKVGEIKDETENADGTKVITYKDRKVKPKEKDKDEYLMDEEGNYIDPRKCNTIDAKYITIGMTSATIEEIEARCNVYNDRKNSRELYESAYNLYMSYIVTNGNTLISNANKIMPLHEALRLSICYKYKDKYNTNDDNISKNFKAFIQYLKSKEKDIYVEYKALNNYVTNKSTGQKFGMYEHEINSILAIAKEHNNTGVNINVLINKDNMEEFKNNTKLIDVLKRKGFKGRENIIVYSL